MNQLAMFGLGVPELLIILAVVLLLFGGSRLAGLGKSTGRALKEFKEETKGLKGDDPNAPPPPAVGQRPTVTPEQTRTAQAPEQTWTAPPPEQTWTAPPSGPVSGASDSEPRRDV